jgi:hypothetical protein
VTVGLGIAITFAGGILAGLITTGSAVRRMTGVSIAAVLLLLPFVMKSLAAPSYVTLTLVCVVALRAVDLGSERPSRSAALRVLHIFMPFDTRLAKRSRPRLDIRQALETIAWAALSYAAFTAAASSPASSLAAHYVVRWLCAIVWVMALFETIAHIISLSLTMLGVHIPILHDAPYKARSLREFWSRRWNKLIGRWIRDHCYRPLARRGRHGMGVIASFVASALIHFYITSVLLDTRWAMLMAVLFLLQIPLLWAEDALQIRRRPVLVGRVWTLGVLLVLSPLFTEPVLRIFHLPPSVARLRTELNVLQEVPLQRPLFVEGSRHVHFQTFPRCQQHI